MPSDGMYKIIRRYFFNKRNKCYFFVKKARQMQGKFLFS
ncbi:unknown [[Mannheimia] succiniciproducens MBEL55E]|uniref:Uncharacterized protein n=1 Tax=Mannheimia succiniciproducens (strain KCTC 0769BP / MBEL55E) TaxID=221988 RepID=Q65SU7_MANSM|nr:unknown [[Mannheimia] succiniciproducens MBEL55E]